MGVKVRSLSVALMFRKQAPELARSPVEIIGMVSENQYPSTYLEPGACFLDITRERSPTAEAIGSSPVK